MGTSRNALLNGLVCSGKPEAFHDNPDRSLLQVFEGCMDFLSYLSADKPTHSAGAVLVVDMPLLARHFL